MSSAFEYDNPTIEEFNLYCECIKLTSIEFDFENPFRVWVRLLISARRRAFLAQRDMQTFCKKLWNNYRNNPNKFKIILMSLSEGILTFIFNKCYY